MYLEGLVLSIAGDLGNQGLEADAHDPHQLQSATTRVLVGLLALCTPSALGTFI